MAFTYRPSEDTENNLAEIMRKKNFKVKSDCIDFLINSHSETEKDLEELKTVINELKKRIRNMEDIIIQDRTVDDLEQVISELSGSLKMISRFRKQINKLQ